MSFLEIFLLVLTGSGTMASVLGVFFAIYARYNGRQTREFIAQENKAMHEFIAQENKAMREFLATVLDKMDSRAEQRHKEIISKL